MHNGGYVLAIGFVLVVAASIYIAIYLKNDFEYTECVDPPEGGPSTLEEPPIVDGRQNDVMPASSFWSAIGFIGLAISFAAAVWAFLMDTTVPAYSLGVSEVNNLGLLQQQMMVYIGSIGMFVAGVVALAAGSILKALGDR